MIKLDIIPKFFLVLTRAIAFLKFFILTYKSSPFFYGAKVWSRRQTARTGLTAAISKESFRQPSANTLYLGFPKTFPRYFLPYCP